MTFDKFFKIAADLTAGRHISDEDDAEFVAQMVELSSDMDAFGRIFDQLRGQSPTDALIDYAKRIASGEKP